MKTKDIEFIVWILMFVCCNIYIMMEPFWLAFIFLIAIYVLYKKLLQYYSELVLKEYKERLKKEKPSETQEG